ncbi:MAG: aminotransferase class IV, partial [Pseudomonadota bacterium]
MSVTGWVYLDGAYMAAENARISPFDRGFLFAQAAYEVTAVYNRKLIDIDPHLRRLSRTLAGLEIEAPAVDLREIHAQLIVRNDLNEGLIYLVLAIRLITAAVEYVVKLYWFTYHRDNSNLE